MKLLDPKTTLWVEFLFRALDILLGLGVVVLMIFVFAHRLSDNEKPLGDLLGWVIGILVALLLAVWLEFYLTRGEVKALQKSNQELTLALKSTGNALFSAIILEYAGRRVKADEMPKLWCDLCWAFREDYYATNYIPAKLIYEQPWADAALQIQIAKINNYNSTVQKTFIVDSDKEVGDLQANKKMMEQVKDRIQVRYCHRKMMKENLATCKMEDELKSFDFGIFDKVCVLVWYLKKNDRSIDGGELVLDKAEIEKYKHFFDSLYQAAHPL